MRFKFNHVNCSLVRQKLIFFRSTCQIFIRKINFRLTVVGANGVHGRNVRILAYKNIQVQNRFDNDIDDVMHLFQGQVVNHVLEMRSNNKFVAFHFVQIMGDGQSGILGVPVLQHVEVERKFVQEIVTIHQRVTVVHIVKAIIAKAPFAPFNLVPVCCVTYKCDYSLNILLFYFSRWWLVRLVTVDGLQQNLWKRTKISETRMQLTETNKRWCNL